MEQLPVEPVRSKMPTRRSHKKGITVEPASPELEEPAQVRWPSSHGQLPDPDNHVLGCDLLRLYKKREFCDITLVVQEATFPAHRSILCSRSPVFHAMFENDSKEKSTGVVNITDMDPDTVDEMLIFVYSDVLDVERNIAFDLYSAADKYQIESLKSKCSSFLASVLDLSNVLDVLALADLHEDADLKKSAHDFIGNNAPAVFKSEGWRNFVIENGRIAADVMRVLFVEKGMAITLPLSLSNKVLKPPDPALGQSPFSFFVSQPRCGGAKC